MKKFLIIVVLICCTVWCYSQKTDSLNINYYSQAPFAYFEEGDAKGVEVEIINEYAAWLKVKKNINIVIVLNRFTDFDSFYGATKNGPKNTIGLGSVTIKSERLNEIDFSPAYLKNVSFCVTNGHSPDIKAKTSDEITRVLGSMTALTLSNTTLNKYVNAVKKTYVKDLKIKNEASEIKILDEIARNVLYFGYVDAVGFWFYIKNNPQKFLKTQKLMNQSNEELAFIMPKGSKHKVLFAEFFNGPAGFKKSKNYRDILEKYLGPYMTQTMAVN